MLATRARPCSSPLLFLAGVKDYLSAALITIGCATFLMTGSVRSKRAAADRRVQGTGGA